MARRTAPAERSAPAFDLNLLEVLLALLEERHVTRAAQRLAMSQPAVSRALARLRSLFDDPLLLRNGTSFSLTERATDLLPRVRATVLSARSLTQPERFDPATAEGTVRIAAPDVVSLLILPALLPMLASAAPGLSLEIVPRTPNWNALLEQGHVDLSLGFPKGTEPDLHARTLLELDWAVVLRSDHPAITRRWTPALYASLPHALVTQLGAPANAIDTQLAALSLSRRPAVRVAHALLAPMLTTRSNLVATTALWLARDLAEHHPLTVRPLPFTLSPIRVQLLWHERAHRDRRNRWLRSLLQSAADSLPQRQLRW